MKNKLQEIMKTEKGPTKIKLSLYFAFLIFTVSFLALSGSFTNNNEVIKNTETNEKNMTQSISFLDKQEKLLKANHSYKYTISGNSSVIFDGKIIDGIDTGYRENNDEIIKYKIVEDKVFKVTKDKEEEYDDLYQNIEKKNLMFKDLFATFNSSSAIINRQENNTIYTYNIDGTSYIIYTDAESIFKIEITSGEYSYVYEFNY